MFNLKHIIAAALAGTTTAAALIAVPAGALTMNYTPSATYQNSLYYTRLTEVELTGNQRVDIANVAMSQLGYHESNTYTDLSGSTLNGYSNYTEYGYWYGSYCAWCAVFVAWCAGQAQIPSDVVAVQAWAGHITDASDTGNFGGKYTPFSLSTPQVGDIAYYDVDYDGCSDHVEIVYEVNDKFITTVGGNTGGSSGEMVKSHNLPRDTGDSGYWRIMGFESPDYEGTDTPLKTVDDELGIDFPRPLRQLTKGSSGSDVAWLQTALNRASDAGLVVDGKFGSATGAAVQNFETAMGMSADNTADKDTYSAIVAFLTGKQDETEESISQAVTEATDSEPVTEVSTESETELPTEAEELDQPGYDKETGILIGDVDGDGVISAIDSSLILHVQALMAIDAEYVMTMEQIIAADYNRDSVVDAIDASLILAYAAKNGISY